MTHLIACAISFGDGDESFGPILRRRRLEKGWSVARLSREAHIKTDTISRWEAGDTEPRWPYRLALREALGISPDDDGGWWARW